MAAVELVFVDTCKLPRILRLTCAHLMCKYGSTLQEETASSGSHCTQSAAKQREQRDGHEASKCRVSIANMSEQPGRCGKVYYISAMIARVLRPVQQSDV